ncbi:MAG: ABC transporter permease [Acidobacteria bacterium]|nr:ABC transporter permease [Acidobacteriota bacterium]
MSDRTFVQSIRRGFVENVRFAKTAILGHKVRTALTVLGIVIGVATVIAMVSMVEGFNRNVTEGFESFGSTLVQFQRNDPQFGPGGGHDNEEQRLRRHLTYEDAMALRELCPAMRSVSPERYWFPSLRSGGQVPTLTYQGREGTPDTVAGVTSAYLDANNKQLALGRFISETDVRRGSSVLVIGWDLADALFPFGDPVGKSVSLSGRRYTVIGVFEKQGASGFESTDAHAMLPFPTFDRAFPWVARDYGVNIATVPFRPEQVDDVLEQGIAVLRQRRGLKFNQPNDFGIMTPDKLISNLRSVTDGISATMILIASIALLVGGVGVMNIMLVSVTERTREIGLRKALGAVRQDILVQFLIEAMALAALGGALGVAIGVGIAALVRNISPLATATPFWSIAVGLGVSASVGLVFGIFPAWRAAKLDPIESLRYE